MGFLSFKARTPFLSDEALRKGILFSVGYSMNFRELYEKISPKLKRLARVRSAHCALLEEDDLYQEACLHLWNNFREGMPEGVNESYIVKSCEFHILNYLRKKRKRVNILTMDEPINEEGGTLGDLLADDKARGEEHIDRAITIDDIRNNGFSDREKQVFSLLIKGCTVREAGRALGISHVMVVRARKSIISKWQREENEAPRALVRGFSERNTERP